MVVKLIVIVLAFSENGWHGVTGKAPTQQQFSSALTDHELFM